MTVDHRAWRLSDVADRDALPEGERWVHDEMMRTRGKILPGYAPLLHCAELVGRIVNVGSYFRFDTGLPADVVEVVALVVSTELGDRYEQAVHRQAAARAGVSAEVVAAICAQSVSTGASCDQLLVVACTRELLASRRMDDASFNRALERFGERGVVEVIGAIGFYAMLGYMHNAMAATGVGDDASMVST